MIRKIMFCLFILNVLASCNKERTIHVKAINPVTNEPYGDLRVVITSSKTGLNGEVVKTVYDGNLNSDGESMINLKIKKNRSYAIRCEQPPNVCYTKELQYYYTVHDEENPSFLFEYAECAFSKLIISNENCEGPDDQFVLYRENQIGSIDGGFGWEHMGCAYWETNGYSEIAMGEVYFRWEVTRSGNTSTYYDTVYYPAGENKIYEINY